MCIYVGVLVHRWKWCCLVRWRHESPRSMSCQHLWVHSPALCRAPCLASPFRLRRSVFRHCLGAGCGVVGRGRGYGRGGGRVCGSHECSTSWVWLLAEVWVVVLAVVGVDGVGFVGVRGCGRGCWSRVGLSRVLSAPPAWRHPTGFAGVSFATVSGLVVGWSSRCLLMVVVVVDGVGHTGVRGCGRSCWPRCGS